jgi:hypothetical protein
LDLLHTYNSELQVFITLSLIHTLYSSPQHAPSLLSVLCLHRLSPGNSSQRRSFSAPVLHSSGPRWLAPSSRLTLQSSLKGYSSRPHGSRTSLRNRSLKTVLLCPWPPACRPTAFELSTRGSSSTDLKKTLLLTCATWHHVFHCRVTCPPGAGLRGNSTYPALLLLPDINIVAETLLRCYTLATCLWLSAEMLQYV